MSSDYELFLGQVNNLNTRRQMVTTTYLSVNAALTGAMAFLFKDGQLSGFVPLISVLTLLFSGIVACSLWRRLIAQHSALLNWWYTQLRLLEQDMPESRKLITKEHQELYQKGKEKKNVVGLTRYEAQLTWLFTLIYSVFGLAILITLLFHLH